ncbi:hypothetical protein [Corynebacterium parakroppenstedtii]|uniref:Uncharacterized protein n=1 Tax=Corynebacterium parakroppenstedtii TaxID=2828363 RepID=A0ABS9HJW2_9CORY|nr:hypothetical protein [Corynebacterium parakroppenstedtii]KXB51398.1 hypothetical protein HMPREF1861_00434 [Corynebacterium kroppenstedtii]MCF6773393.1 hypothetical protein [Corynebacterium parakroppenstedtii]UWY21225.1 hypothetical protein N2K96_05940 [Corynebacterium kroppenstedtii]
MSGKTGSVWRGSANLAGGNISCADMARARHKKIPGVLDAREEKLGESH